MSTRRRISEVDELYRNLIHPLNAIGIRLSAEKNADKLTELILEECMRITHSDGGSIYIRESDDTGAWITFKHTSNYSRDFPFVSFSLPINNTSFAGYCAATGDSLNFSSLDNTETLVGIRHNDVFDRMNNYHTRNMLVAPMKDVDGLVIGVLQLINKKKAADIKLQKDSDYEDFLIPYTSDEEEIVTSLASQAAILLERTRLYEEIQELFRTFSEAMVTALDKRDPVTAGHSKRVADYAVALAKAINSLNDDTTETLAFSEGELKKLYYAGLLHDIGKVGIDESLLVKNNRLSKDRVNAIRYRFHYLKTKLIYRKTSEDLSEEDSTILDSLDSWLDSIEKYNTRGYLTSEEAAFIRSFAHHTFEDIDGLIKPLLDAYELDALTILKGNLTTVERREMEKHPRMTLEVLREIRWSHELKEVPLIAASHHEKLNGKGYPQGLKEKDIPLMSKILAIVDIFDALTSKDRPYRPAVLIEKTLEILQEEVKCGNLDPDLARVFIECRPFQEIFDTSFPGSYTPDCP